MIYQAIPALFNIW